jgi:hypothetical protein
MADTPISRDELVKELAAVSHSTWMLQAERDNGADRASLPPEVQPHDLERAEHTVQRLEELGIVGWPNGR